MQSVSCNERMVELSCYGNTTLNIGFVPTPLSMPQPRTSQTTVKVNLDLDSELLLGSEKKNGFFSFAR